MMVLSMSIWKDGQCYTEMDSKIGDFRRRRLDFKLGVGRCRRRALLTTGELPANFKAWMPAMKNPIFESGAV